MKQALAFLAKLAIAATILFFIWDEFDGSQFAYVLERPALALLLPVTWLVMVFLLDRAIGLFCILFWCSCFGILLAASQGMREIPYWYVPGLMLVAGIMGALAGLVLKDLVKRYRWSQKFVPLIDMLDLMFNRQKITQLAAVVLSSLAAVFVLLGGSVILGATLHSEITGDSAILEQFFLVPLSLVASMIPIAPLGVGVSQFTLSVAYEALGLVSTVGVSVSTWSQLGALVISVIFGGYFFVAGRRAVTGQN